MDIKEFDRIVENILTNEIKHAILKESVEEKYEVYHIKCEGEPVETCHSKEDAQIILGKLEKEHPNKKFIIEKTAYESKEDMIHKLDEMGKQLEEKENQDMENTQMDEKLVGNQDKLDKNHNGELDAQDFDMLRGQQDEEECMECGQMEEGDTYGEEHTMCECGGMVSEEGICNECGMMHEHAQDGDAENICPKCGKEVCECYGMYEESKKKTIRLSESQLAKVIKMMVHESIPGLEAAKEAHKKSGEQNTKELNDMMKEIERAHLSFENNDKPEFPHQLNSKTKKMAHTNSEKQDEEVAKNFAGLQNLEYDVEPGEDYKKRQKMAIEGDSLMGNGPITEKPSITPSNGAPKGKEAKEKEGNHIQTPETAKKLNTQIKDREKDKKDRVLYPKEAVPVNESKVSFSNILNEEVEKMKKLYSYDKKTQ